MNERLYLLFIIAAFLFFNACKCERSLEGELVNSMGDAGRCSNYEHAGAFYTNLVISNKPQGLTDSSGAIAPPLLLSSAEWCVASSKGSIILTTRNGMLWRYSLTESEIVAAAMCADRLQNIYAITNKGSVIKLNRRGELQWQYNVGIADSLVEIFYDLLITDYGLIATKSSGRLICLTYEGKLKWDLQFSSDIADMPAASESGNIALNLTKNEFGSSDTLLFLSKDGKRLFSKAFDATRLLKYPVINDNQILCTGVYDKQDMRISKLFCLDTNGKITWEKEISVMTRHISCTSEGETLVTGYNSGLGEAMSGIFCFEKSGKLKWNLYYDMRIPSPLIIGKNEIVAYGVTKKAPGVFLMNRNGTLIKTISLSNVPIILPQANVTPDGVITFLGSEAMAIISIDDTPMNKIFPR